MLPAAATPAGAPGMWQQQQSSDGRHGSRRGSEGGSPARCTACRGRRRPRRRSSGLGGSARPAGWQGRGGRRWQAASADEQRQTSSAAPGAAGTNPRCCGGGKAPAGAAHAPNLGRCCACRALPRRAAPTPPTGFRSPRQPAPAVPAPQCPPPAQKVAGRKQTGVAGRQDRGRFQKRMGHLGQPPGAGCVPAPLRRECGGPHLESIELAIVTLSGREYHSVAALAQLLHYFCSRVCTAPGTVRPGAAGADAGAGG